MVDLNLWRLEYPGTVLEFGTHESGHPFTRQVVVGPADLETDDMVHPMSDGVTMGRDFARGRAIEFVGAHLSTLPQPLERRWERPMDDQGSFSRAWRARSVRETPGALATLANVDRERLVYGRPRPFVPDHERARQGWVTYACAFATVDDRFYSTTEQVMVAGVGAGELTALTFPLTFPVQGVAPSETRAWLTNGGDDDTWPTVTFRRGGNPRVELLNGAGGVLWSLEVAAQLEVDQEVTVDLRPWSRSVLLNGASAPGLLRGSSLDQVRIPAGIHELRLVADDPTGLAEVEVRWRDAFGAL